MPPQGAVLMEFRTNRVCRHVLSDLRIRTNCASSGTLMPPQEVVMPSLGAVMLPGSSVPPEPMSDVSGTLRTFRIRTVSVAR